MSIEPRLCQQKWQLENHYASSGQNCTLNFINATWKCENRRTSENALLLYSDFLYLQECFEDGFLHVPLLVLLLAEDELVQVILQVVGDPGTAVAVVHAEVGQVRVLVQVRESGTSEKVKTF